MLHYQAPGGRIALSVNVNKVALLRNARAVGLPSVVEAATWALQAGAQGITVHPRPDERHITRQDVFDLAQMMQAWPQAEFNIEGNPDHELLPLLSDLCQAGLPVHQCTFVPDTHQQSTSDHGWDVLAEQARLRDWTLQAQGLGLRVSVFVEPAAHLMPVVQAIGADRIELYTEPYARWFSRASSDEQKHKNHAQSCEAYQLCAQAAVHLGLGVNAGHDLNRHNLPFFCEAIPQLKEVSIGHALVADALEFGMRETVRRYLACLRVEGDGGANRSMRA